MMKKTNYLTTFFLLVVVPFLFIQAECNQPPMATSGAKEFTPSVEVGSDGMTAEQRNIDQRIRLEKPGAIKHLYVISPYSGQVLIYSTVKGKVTSSGKRLSPIQAASGEGGGEFLVPGITGSGGNGDLIYTNEILQDDGTYGNSEPYVYWFDAQGRYHQHFFTGGQIIHVSDQPLAVKSVIINMEISGTEELVSEKQEGSN